MAAFDSAWAVSDNVHSKPHRTHLFFIDKPLDSSDRNPKSMLISPDKLKSAVMAASYIDPVTMIYGNLRQSAGFGKIPSEDFSVATRTMILRCYIKNGAGRYRSCL